MIPDAPFLNLKKPVCAVVIMLRVVALCRVAILIRMESNAVGVERTSIPSSLPVVSFGPKRSTTFASTFLISNRDQGPEYVLPTPD